MLLYCIEKEVSTAHAHYEKGIPTCNIMEPNSKKMRIMSPDDEEVPIASSVGLECIPNEVLCLICQLLPLRNKLYLRHVSRKFYSLLNDSSLWKCVAIGPVECKNVKFVKGVVKFLKPFVTTLAVNGFPHPPSSLIPLLTSCQQVKSLSLVGSSFPYAALERIINNIPHLSRLVIPLPPYSAHELFDERYVISELPAGSIKQLVMIYTAGTLLFVHLAPSLTFNVPNVAIICAGSLLPPPNTTCDFPNYDAVMSIYRSAQFDSRIRLTPSFTVTNCATRLSVEGTSSIVTLVKAVSTSITIDSYIYYHITSCDRRVVTNGIVPSTPLTKAIGSTVTSLDCGFDNAVVFTNIVQYTPNLIVLNLNTADALQSDDIHCMPLDEVFGVLSVYCKCLQYIHCALCDDIGSKDPACEVGDVDKLWESINSLKQLKHLSICSCFFIPTQLQAVEGAGSNSTGRVSRMLEIAKCFKPDLKLLPHTLCSLSVTACKSKVPYPLQDILTIVSKIVSLNCLRVSVQLFGSSMISMHALQKCENLEEFALIRDSFFGDLFVQYDPVVVQRLKHLTLSHVSLPITFFADLIPLSGTNQCLETLALEVDNLPDNLVSTVKRCRKLVSCRICFQKGIAYSTTIRKSDFKANCLLWFTVFKRSSKRTFATHSSDLLHYRM